MFLVAGSMNRWCDHFTASAVNFSPLWNETSSRSFSSQVVGLTWLYEVASHGLILRSESNISSDSNMLRIMLRGADAWVCWGSRLVVSAPWAMVSVPVGFAAAAGADGLAASAGLAAVLSAGF